MKIKYKRFTAAYKVFQSSPASHSWHLVGSGHCFQFSNMQHFLDCASELLSVPSFRLVSVNPLEVSEAPLPWGLPVTSFVRFVCAPQHASFSSVGEPVGGLLGTEMHA